MRRGALAARAWALAACCVVGVCLLASGAARAGGTGPGAYCPLPEKGEVRTCLAPAQETYADFFAALEGDADDEALSGVEAAVARGAREERAYLALSSLAYGYYRLARRAAASDTTDPRVTSRLARWNDLLARAYRESPGDARYRAAVRQAAEDLSVRAPIRLPCRDDHGRPAACSSTESVLRGIDAARDEVGIRGALARVIRRFFGGSGP